ncbi:MAG: hypothetical protein K2Q09_04075, partial [Phycisphaerales bacterium]|nr:hypothetical protein [Phycisphaerales bacterium]
MTRMTVRSSSPTLVSAAAAIVGLAGARLCMADIVSRTMDVVLDGARIDVDGDGVPDVEFSLVKLPEVQAGGRVGLGLAARGRRNGASRCEVLERYSRYSGGGRDGGAFEASEGMSLRIAG